METKERFAAFFGGGGHSKQALLVLFKQKVVNWKPDELNLNIYVYISLLSLWSN